MKSRIISAVFIALFLTAVCVFSYVFTEAYSRDITDRTNDICSGNVYNEKRTDELEARWEKYSKFAALYTDHEELEKVELLINKLNETDDISETMFKMNCTELKLIMEHLNESEKPLFKNIF